MTQTLRSPRVDRIVVLRRRAARLRANYEAAQTRLAPTRHRANQFLQEARVLKGQLTPPEITQLRRAWSGF